MWAYLDADMGWGQKIRNRQVFGWGKQQAEVKWKVF